jgi:hypothetical protein
MLVFVMFLAGLLQLHTADGQRLPDQFLRTSSTADINTTRPVKPANTDGVVFDFAEYGGAAAYIASMETGLVDGLLRQTRWKGGAAELARKLDSDPELVGAGMLTKLTIFACCSEVRLYASHAQH